jgi:large subunit ribosomal protein L5
MPDTEKAQEAQDSAKLAKQAAAKKGAGGASRKRSGRADAGKRAPVVELAQDKLRRTAPSRLSVLYRATVQKQLMKDLGLRNVMEVPRLTKITVNMGLGEAITNAKVIDGAIESLALVCGQKPVATRARRSIANFKLREGQKIGAMVTLRHHIMYEFFDRLVSFALPRMRDFKGVSPKAFDGRGNYTLGIRESVIFPEVSFEVLEKAKGMNITITTTARTDEHGRTLLQHLGMPFRS